MLSQLSTILFTILCVDNGGASEQELLLFACFYNGINRFIHRYVNNHLLYINHL